MGPGVTRPRSWAAAVVVVVGLAFMVNDTGDGPGPPAEAPSRAQGDGCAQWAYLTDGTRQRNEFTWVLNVSSVPAYLDRAQAVHAVRSATETIALGRSNCPPGDNAGAALPRVLYAGPTQREANVTPAGECFPPGNTDGINAVSFGRLPEDVAAVTCSYTYRGDIWQSDVMLNDAPGVFTTTPDDASCLDSFDLQSVMTHERGHSFGLGHVPEGPGTAALTMSSMMGRCDPSGRTLGPGDVAGLLRLY